MKLRGSISRISLIRFFIPLFLLQTFSMQPMSPQNVSALIITTASKIDICCATLESQIDQLTNIVNTGFSGTFTSIEAIVTSACDLSSTNSLINVAIEQGFTTQSKLDECCFNLASKIDTIAIDNSCDLSGTYTLLNAAIAQEFTTQSKLDLCCSTINSKVDSLTDIVNADFAGTFTAIAAIPAANFTGTYTVLNTILGQEITTQSKVDLCCATLNSKIDALSGLVAADFANTFTVLANIRQEETVIESKVDALTNIVNADFAATFTAIAAIPAANFTGTYTVLNTLLGQEITTQSKVDLCCATLNSKIDALSGLVASDFAATFTVLADIRQEETVIESKVDALTNIVNADFAGTFSAIAAIPAANFTGTYTVLNTVLAQEITTQSKIDLCCATLNSKIDSLSGIVVADFAGTFTALANIRQEETTIESKVDALTNIVNADFAGTFTALAASSCNLSGTYTAIQALGQCNATPLTLTSAGTTITTAGVYCLTSNVTLGSSNSITITSSDVVVDLNNKTVFGGNTSSAGNQAAIIINADRVAVKNGFMTNNGFTAITVLNTRAHANINNIQITNCSRGIFANGMNTSIFDSITFKNCSSSSFFILGAFNCLVSNCQVQGGANLGFSTDSSSAIVFKNCLAEGAGFGFNTANPSGGIILDSCVASNCSIDGFIMNFQTNQTIKLVNCIAQNCVNGFNVAGSNVGVVEFKNCQALRNSTNGFILALLQAGLVEDCSAINNANAGFLFNNGSNVSSQVIINNCQAVSNSTDGFDLSGTTSCSLNYCTASNNGLTSGSGFNLNGASTCSITNCQADDNSMDGFDGSLAGACCVVGDCYAFSNTFTGFAGNANVSFFNNVAQCNTTNFDDFSASSAASGMLDSKVDALSVQGIDIQSDIEQCCSTVISKIDALTNIVNADFAGTFTAIAAISGGSCDLSGTYTVLNALGLCNAIPLSLTSTGTTISTPGVYCLAGDVTLGASNSILINTSGVILDLNRHTVSGAASAPAAIRIGVATSPNVSRVSVRNGYMSNPLNSSSAGTAISLVSPFAANNLVFENINITGFTNGLNANNANNSIIRNVIVYGANTSGISSNGSQNIIENCHAERISGGIAYTLSGQNVKVSHCTAYFNGNGFVASGVESMVFDSCTASVHNGAPFNVSLAGAGVCSLINCIANDNFGGFTLAGDSSAQASLVNCQSLRSGSAHAFDIQAQNCVLENCIAESSGGSGFTLASAAPITNCTFKNCVSNFNTLQGFDLLGSTNCTLENCNSTNNTGSGFSLDSASQCLIKNATASTNGVTGFDGSNAGVCCLVQDSTSLSNTFTGFAGNANVSFYNNIAQCNTPNFDDFSASSAESGMLDSKVDALSVQGLDIQSDIDQCCSTVVSRIDSLTNLVSKDFAGTFTAIAAISGGTSNACAAISLIVPSTGTTISTSGVYCIANDIDIGANRILISATNVVLDLNQKTIVGSSATGIIQISDGHPYCTIENGTIIASSPSAIGIEAGTNDYLTFKDLAINNVSIGIDISSGLHSIVQSVYVVMTGGQGINVANGSGDIIFNDCVVDGPASAGLGFLISSSTGATGIVFNRCISNNCGAGFQVNNCEPSFYNCQSSYASGGNFIVGNDDTATDLRIYFENCFARAAGTVNFYILFTGNETTSIAVFKNCTSENGTTGFEIDHSATGCFLSGCSSIGSTDTGFRLIANFGTIFENCTASMAQGHGFQLTNCAYCTLRGCIASNGLNNGFYLNNGFKCTVTGCTAIKNPVGFVADGATPANNIFFANGATQNTTSYSGVTSPPSAPQVLFAAGVYGANLADVLP